MIHSSEGNDRNPEENDPSPAITMHDILHITPSKALRHENFKYD